MAGEKLSPGLKVVAHVDSPSEIHITIPCQASDVDELRDEQLEGVVGGFWWVILAPVIRRVVIAVAGAVASHFAVEGVKKSVKAVRGSDAQAEVIGEGVGLFT